MPAIPATAPAEGVLDRLPVGVVGIDARGRTLFATAPARSMLQGTSALVLEHDRLTARRDDVRRSLDDALVQLVHDERSAAPATHDVIVPRAAPAPLRVTLLRPADVAPALTSEPPSVPDLYAVAVIADPLYQPSLPTAVLTRMFGLTPTEARLACALVEGSSLAGFARRQGTSLYTTRSHFRRIKRKLAAADKADVVRILVLSGLVGGDADTLASRPTRGAGGSDGECLANSQAQPEKRAPSGHM